MYHHTRRDRVWKQKYPPLLSCLEEIMRYGIKSSSHPNVRSKASMDGSAEDKELLVELVQFMEVYHTCEDPMMTLEDDNYVQG
jgi:hypothetical protein